MEAEPPPSKRLNNCRSVAPPVIFIHSFSLSLLLTYLFLCFRGVRDGYGGGRLHGVWPGKVRAHHAHAQSHLQNPPQIELTRTYLFCSKLSLCVCHCCFCFALRRHCVCIRDVLVVRGDDVALVVFYVDVYI